METTSGENEERLRAFLQSRAWRIWSWVRYTQTTFYVYEANWRDLRSHVDKLQDPRFSLLLHSVDHPVRMDDYVLEFSRLLHNFLSAAQTLVEHTQRAVENLYSGDPFENEFKQKREQILLDSGIRQFVARLRNMVLHRHSPALTVTRGFDSATSDIALPVEKLRESYKWDRLSLKFMGNASHGGSKPHATALLPILEPLQEFIVKLDLSFMMSPGAVLTETQYVHTGCTGIMTLQTITDINFSASRKTG